MQALAPPTPPAREDRGLCGKGSKPPLAIPSTPPTITAARAVPHGGGGPTGKTGARRRGRAGALADPPRTSEVQEGVMLSFLPTESPSPLSLLRRASLSVTLQPRRPSLPASRSRRSPPVMARIHFISTAPPPAPRRRPDTGRRKESTRRGQPAAAPGLGLARSIVRRTGGLRSTLGAWRAWLG